MEIFRRKRRLGLLRAAEFAPEELYPVDPRREFRQRPGPDDIAAEAIGRCRQFRTFDLGRNGDFDCGSGRIGPLLPERAGEDGAARNRQLDCAVPVDAGFDRDDLEFERFHRVAAEDEQIGRDGRRFAVRRDPGRPEFERPCRAAVYFVFDGFRQRPVAPADARDCEPRQPDRFRKVDAEVKLFHRADREVADLRRDDPIRLFDSGTEVGDGRLRQRMKRIKQLRCGGGRGERKEKEREGEGKRDVHDFPFSSRRLHWPNRSATVPRLRGIRREAAPAPTARVRPGTSR